MCVYIYIYVYTCIHIYIYTHVSLSLYIYIYVNCIRIPAIYYTINMICNVPIRVLVKHTHTDTHTHTLDAVACDDTACSIGGSLVSCPSPASEKGLSGLSQNNNFQEHSRRKQHKTKLDISGGATVSGSFGFSHLQSNPLKNHFPAAGIYCWIPFGSIYYCKYISKHIYIYICVYTHHIYT